MIEAFPCAKTTAVVSRRTGVPVDAIRSRSRYRPHVRARQITIYLAKTVRGLSYPQIGRAFGLDHTTCLHSVSVVRKLMSREDYPEFLRLVEDCRADLQADMRRIEREAREKRRLSLPLRITTEEVLYLAGVSKRTLIRLVRENRMPRPVCAGWFDRDAVLGALGLLDEPATP